jgi:hypothetical protein
MFDIIKMSEPTGARNISQSLFMMDEKLMNDPKHLSNKLMAARNVSSWNSIGQPQGIDNQIPAYLNQSRLSTYYQDNPWPTLQFSNRFGLAPMGGPINPSLTPGHRPGNVLNKNKAAQAGYAMGQTVPNAMIGSGYVPQNAFSSEGSPIDATPYNKVPVRQPGYMNPIQPVNKNGVEVPSFMTGFGINKSAY